MDTALTDRLIALSSSLGQRAKRPLVNYMHPSPVADGVLVEGDKAIRCSRSFFSGQGDGWSLNK